MASAQDIVNEWAADSEEKLRLLKTRSGLGLRWLNQAQLRYVERAECLRDVWNPTITSSGNISLPSDFMYEFSDRVKRDVNSTSDYYLRKVDYPIAFARSWSGLTAYSIYNGSFYIWAAGAATPSIPYVKKPAIITTLSSASLEIPTEFQHRLVDYMDAMWLRYKGDVVSARGLMEDFFRKSKTDGVTWRLRYDKSPIIRSNFF